MDISGLVFLSHLSITPPTPSHGSGRSSLGRFFSQNRILNPRCQSPGNQMVVPRFRLRLLAWVRCPDDDDNGSHFNACARLNIQKWNAFTCIPRSVGILARSPTRPDLPIQLTWIHHSDSISRRYPLRSRPLFTPQRSHFPLTISNAPVISRPGQWGSFPRKHGTAASNFVVFNYTRNGTEHSFAVLPNIPLNSWLRSP